MNETVLFIIFLLFGLLIGGIPTGKLVGKYRNIDIQKLGSGNIGATNIKRILGTKWAVLVAGIDILKSLLTTAIAYHYLDNFSLVLGVGLSIVAGNIFSPFLGFKGGKGVGHAVGVLTIFDPISTLISGLFLLGISKIIGVKSIASFAGLGLITFLFLTFDTTETWFILAVDGLILFAHKENIQRLFQQKELKTKSKI